VSSRRAGVVVSPSGVRMKKLSGAVVGLSALLSIASACTTPRPFYDYAAEPDPRKQEFILGPSDVLRVNVWRNPELGGEVTIRPDGTISLPLIGDIPAAGRTAADVRTDISKRLQAYIKDDANNVTLSVATINSYRFVVNGNVEHTGVFTSNRYVTVSEAIALAGGPNRFASPEETTIIRLDSAKGKKRIPVDYPAILTGKHPEHDLTLLAGDIVYVP
jgi:polysaccharide export outer membrane protein